MTEPTGPDAAGTAAWGRLEAALRGLTPLHREAEPSDPVVARYLGHAVAEHTPLAHGAYLDMRGRIKIGRWLPFTATQLLAPRLGTVWRARVAGVITGSDRYVDGIGGMDWRALHFVPLVHGAGPDVTRSAAERAAGESIWVPTALWPQPGVRWSGIDESHVEVGFDVGGHPATVRHTIDDRGAVRSSSFERWGDPERTGTWASHIFGVEVTGEQTFDGLTIPSRGRAGWHFGTSRWDGGAFFEYQITGLRLIR